MNKMQLKKEARALQGKTIELENRTLKVAGQSAQAEFEMGSEGLVHLATDERSGKSFRIKCFWEPDEVRQRRSQYLVDLQLADQNKSIADALGGAPIEMLPSLGAYTPFAVLMRSIRGESWRSLKTRAEADPEYPPQWWPPTAIRATWAYGLATAVMKMETREFIHADISPGNVVVNDGLHFSSNDAGTENGQDDAGDMALVDFDRYVHGRAEVSQLGQGSAGYASPEVWKKAMPQIGTDRTSMAILIQEFLVIGDPELRKEEALDWSYDQDSLTFHLNSTEASISCRVPVHPVLARKYPALASLVAGTVSSISPATRPAPQSWRDPLKEIVNSPERANSSRLLELTLEQVADSSQRYRMVFKRAMRMLDLSETRFRINASLKRDADESIYLVVHDRACLNIRFSGGKPIEYQGGKRIEVQAGMILVDPIGAMSARLVGPLP
jgi:hypothetical protein